MKNQDKRIKELEETVKNLSTYILQKDCVHEYIPTRLDDINLVALLKPGKSKARCIHCDNLILMNFDDKIKLINKKIECTGYQLVKNKVDINA